MAVKKSNRKRATTETKPKAARKAKHDVNSQKVASLAIPAVIGAIALPAIASAVTLSTAVIGGIAGVAVAISYMAGKNDKKRARHKGGK